MISSLDQKPAKGGMPDSARPPTIMQPEVKGIARRKPDMRSMSWIPAMAEMTEPAAMNSSALKKAYRGRDQQRQSSHNRPHSGGRRRVLEQRVQARDQVDAGGHHSGGVDQR